MDFKIKRSIKIISGVLLTVFGWLSLGIGFTIKCPHPYNTSIYIRGFLMIVLGIIVLVIKNKTAYKRRS